MADHHGLTFSILFAVTFAYILTSSNPIAYVVQEPITQVETYTEKVPKQIEEDMPFEIISEEEVCEEGEADYEIHDVEGSYECIRYSTECGQEESYCTAVDVQGNCIQLSTNCLAYACEERRASCSFKVKSLEQRAFEFGGSMLFTENGKRHESSEIRETIMPEEDVLFSWDYDMKSPNSNINCNYVIEEVPKVEKCEIKEVSTIINKRRLSIVYEEIEKTREVNTTVNITKTKHVNRFLGYEQGFNLGY